MLILVKFVVAITAIIVMVRSNRKGRKRSRPMTDEERQHEQWLGDFYQDEAAHQQHLENMERYDDQIAAMDDQWDDYDPWYQSDQD